MLDTNIYITFRDAILDVASDIDHKTGFNGDLGSISLKDTFTYESEQKNNLDSMQLNMIKLIQEAFASRANSYRENELTPAELRNFLESSQSGSLICLKAKYPPVLEKNELTERARDLFEYIDNVEGGILGYGKGDGIVTGDNFQKYFTREKDLFSPTDAAAKKLLQQAAKSEYNIDNRNELTAKELESFLLKSGYIEEYETKVAEQRNSASSKDSPELKSRSPDIKCNF